MLHHIVEGAGDPVLLLNGIAMSEASWEPVAAELRHRFTVLRCDLRGQLLSPGDPPADVGGHVADVIALLDELHVRHVHVLATSFGGAVGALLAARHPKRVLSLVSVASADGFDQQMAAEVARWRDAAARAGAGPDRGVLADVLQPVVYSDAWLEEHVAERAAARDLMGGLPDHWFRDLVRLIDTAEGFRIDPAELARVACPTLVLAAEHDRFIPRERCRRIAEAIPGARFDVLPGAGHAAVIEQPREVARRFVAFVEGLESLRRGA